MSLEAWGDEGDIGCDGYVTEERADKMVQEALDEYIANHSWKPIATAPDDSSEILLFIPSMVECPVVAGSVNQYGTVWRIYEAAGDEYGSVTTQDATHWMPLPLPPVQPSRDRDA